jgi:hypothetical protein
VGRYLNLSPATALRYMKEMESRGLARYTPGVASADPALRVASTLEQIPELLANPHLLGERFAGTVSSALVPPVTHYPNLAISIYEVSDDSSTERRVISQVVDSGETVVQAWNQGGTPKRLASNPLDRVRFAYRDDGVDILSTERLKDVTGLPKTTLHRVLNQMRDSGLLSQARRGWWQLGASSGPRRHPYATVPSNMSDFILRQVPEEPVWVTQKPKPQCVAPRECLGWGCDEHLFFHPVLSRELFPTPYPHEPQPWGPMPTLWDED